MEELIWIERKYVKSKRKENKRLWLLW